MAKRVMVATAYKAKGKIPTKYRLTADEMIELTSMVSNSEDGLHDALIVAFRFGFVLGTRAARKGKTIEL